MTRNILIFLFWCVAAVTGCTTTTEFGNKTTTMETDNWFKWVVESEDDPFDGPNHTLQQTTRNTYSNTIMKFNCQSGKYIYSIKSMKVLATPNTKAVLKVKADDKPVEEFSARFYSNSYDSAFLIPINNQYERMVDIYNSSKEIAIKLIASGDYVQGLQFTTDFNQTYPNFETLCKTNR